MPTEQDFSAFVGMTRNEIEYDPDWQFMYRAYCSAWEEGDLVEVDRILPKLGMHRVGMKVEWIKP